MTMVSDATGPVRMVKLSCGGEEMTVAEQVWEATADDLFAKHGAVPKVEWVDGAPAPAIPAPEDTVQALPDVSDTVVPPAPETPAPAVVIPPTATRRGLSMTAPGTVLEISAEGKARSQADFDAAERAGFAPAQSIFERGTKVIQMGVDNARKARAEFDAMPTSVDGCDEFIAQIAQEQRADIDTEVRSMCMTQTAQIEYWSGRDGHTVTRPITKNAFASMCNRMGFGGSTYLGEKCWPELRAHNVNEQLRRMNASELAVRQDLAMKGKTPEWRQLRMRERASVKGGREVFGVVTDSYTPFDVDQIAAAIREAVPEDARGRVTYDGERARFEVLFHTNVQPENFVAGEFFRAGVVISTDDTGGGSIGGSAVVWQNLCLNLLIIDEAKQGLFRIRHIGNRDELVARFRSGFAAALASIGHFQETWGFAVKQDAVTQALKAAEEPLVPVSVALPGLFRGIIERELVPVFARTEAAIPKLMTMWERDASSARAVSDGSRAAVVNAFTAYAHQAAELDPWQEDQIQKAAGRLLYARKPLPYMGEPEKK